MAAILEGISYIVLFISPLQTFQNVSLEVYSVCYSTRIFRCYNFTYYNSKYISRGHESLMFLRYVFYQSTGILISYVRRLPCTLVSFVLPYLTPDLYPGLPSLLSTSTSKYTYVQARRYRSRSLKLNVSARCILHVRF